MLYGNNYLVVFYKSFDTLYKEIEEYIKDLRLNTRLECLVFLHKKW